MVTTRRESGVCQLFTVPYDLVENSPCLQEAPATIGSYIYDERCGLNKTQLSCLEHKRCAWYLLRALLSARASIRPLGTTRTIAVTLTKRGTILAFLRST